MAAVDRLPLDIGTKLQVSIGSDGSSSNERALEGLMERLHSKAGQFKSWTENAKAVRVALMDKRYVLDSGDRTQLQKCLDSLQKSIKVTSLQSMVERLESISRQLGLTFSGGPNGTDCFISSDMFYVEVLLETTGSVKDVKIAHHGDPLSCPELYEVLSKGDFVEFTKHLEGLSSIYQLNADKKQKSKAYMALQALETDLTMLSQLQSSINDPCNLVHKSPVGILQTRRGGHAMKLTYFISPYDLLDMESKTLIPLTVDAVIEKQLGYSVMVCIESSATHKLQTQSLMSIARTADGKSLPSFAAPSNLNSTTLPASFVLRLDSPMPLAIALIRKIQAVTHIDCADFSTCQPLLSLITRQASKGEIESHTSGFFVTLPDQHHCYFLNGVSDLQGVLVSSIPFTHPTHVPQILIFLRQQALFNVLVSSCIRPSSKQDIETALMFEVSALSWLHITVSFEHPLEESMATAELDLSDITNVKCKLHTMPSDLPICADEYASKVIQRCLSIPITMRALIRKAQGQQQLRMNQTNGELFINSVSNGGGGSGSGGLLGHSSPFSESGGNGGVGGGGSKFVTDFDVKMNGRETDARMSESHGGGGGGGGGGTGNGNGPKVEMMSPNMSSYSVSSDIGTRPSSTLDSQGFGVAAVTTSQSNTSSCDLFSVPPERAGPSSLLGNVLSQAVPPPSLQRTQQAQSHSTALPLTPTSQGKPNAMLMNLLNDVPQGQPMTGGSGGSGSSQVVKSRKRKRKVATDASSPRSITGRSPKSSRPSEDECSKDLPTPDVESGDSIGLSFDVNMSTSVTINPVSSVSVSDGHAVKQSSTTVSLDAFMMKYDSVSPHITTGSSSDCVLSSATGGSNSLPLVMSTSVAESSASLGSLKAGEFQFKAEPIDFDAEMLDAQVASLASSLTDDNDFSLDGCTNNTFTISSSTGSTIKLASSGLDKTKDGKKLKKLKLEMTHNKSEDREIPLGKEIEKIPILLDITSSGESKSVDVSPRVTEHLDRRPSVEIIPLGMGSSTPASAPPMHTANNPLNVFGTSIKITKPPYDVTNNKKDVKPRQRDVRRSNSEILNRKTKFDGKKERKRKRLDSFDGMVLDGGGGGGIKPPKVINVITPIPTSHVGASSTNDKGPISMMTHKTLDIPVSRPLTLNVKPAPGSGSPNISVSVTKTVGTPTPTTSSNKKPVTTSSSSSSPNVSPTLSTTSPTKTVSILKTTQSGTSTKPKLPLTKLLSGNLSSKISSSSSSSSTVATSSSSDSTKPSDTMSSTNTKVTISPLKVQNKNKQGLSVKNGSQGVGGGGGGQTITAKVPTKPATVKLKQLNLSSVSSAATPTSGSGGASTVTTIPRSVSSPTISKAMSVGTPVNIVSSGSASTSPVSMSSSVSGTNTPTVASSPTSVTPPSTKSQSSLLQSSLTAAQKVSKLLARSRKASLSSVIDKLSMQLQHTGSGELIPVESGGGGGGGGSGSGSRKGVDGIPRPDNLSIEKRESKGDKKESQGNVPQKTGESRPAKSTQDTKTSDLKKPEFTVKSSSQGIKLTVTKTHSTEGGTKLSSSIRGSSSSKSHLGSMKFCTSPSSLSKIGSATGLKPGVNSGPASKKFGPMGPKTPGMSPVSGQSKSPVAFLSSSPKSSASTPPSSSPSHSMPSMSQPKVSPSSTTTTTASNSVSKAVNLKHSANGGKSTLAHGSKPPDKTVKGGGGGGGSGAAEGRPSTPKWEKSPVAPIVSSVMPPPPPPPPPTLQEFTLQPVKRGDDSPVHPTPIRQFPKLPRESLLEESEAERAFQRLLQAQSNLGAFTKVNPQSNSNGDLGMLSKTEGPRTPKSADLSDKSPKSNTDGRSTPKSFIYERPGAMSPSIAGTSSTSSTVVSNTTKMNVMENKRPATPKLDILTSNKPDHVQLSSSQSPAVSPSSSSSSSLSNKSIATPKCNSAVVKGRASPASKDASSPEDSLVIDCPSTPVQKSPDSRNSKLPKPLSVAPMTSNEVVTATNQPIKSPAEVRMSPSPSIQSLKSPSHPSPAVRSPAVASTPLSEHSNPSSVAHSSPYDIDDDLMDEALVGLGK